MDGLPCKKDYFCAAPLCLHYVNTCKQLVPIAIQLKRQPAEDNPIFLPIDSRSDWLLAKMYFSNASAQVTLFTICMKEITVDSKLALYMPNRLRCHIFLYWFFSVVVYNYYISKQLKVKPMLSQAEQTVVRSIQEFILYTQ